MALANRERGVGLSDSDAWFHLTPEGKRHLRRGMRFAGGFLLCWVVLWAIAEYWPR